MGKKETDTSKIQRLADYVVSDGYNIKSREFNTLLSILLPKIKGYLHSVSFDHDSLVIEDLTSDTFESICKYINTYKADHKFITWSYSIAMHTLIKSVKGKSNIDYERINDDDDQTSDYNADINFDFDTDAFSKLSLSEYIIKENDNIQEKNEAIGELYSILMNFDDSIDKDIFIHKEINKILEKDLAKHYNMNINTVKSKALYFKKKLANKINDNHNDILNVINIKPKKISHVR